MFISWDERKGKFEEDQAKSNFLAVLLDWLVEQLDVGQLDNLERFNNSRVFA